MKKIFVGCVILALGMLQMPASAIVYDQWSTLQYGFSTDWSNLLQLPLIMGKDITAPSDGGNISTNNPYQATIFLPSDYTLTGTGTGPVIWVNADCAVEINDGSGNSNINNLGSTQPTIMNNGPLTLYGVTLENGIEQNNSQYKGTTYIGARSSNSQGTGTVLNGNNNITVGVFSFAPGTTDTYVDFNGGTIGPNVNVSVDGTQNFFNINGGNLTLNGQMNTDWEMGGQIHMTSGSLTLTDFSHTTLNTSDQSGNNCYIQTGGTLNLTNNSSLILNDGSGSYIRGGGVNISGGSSLNIENGIANNNAAIVMSGSNNTLSVGNFNSTATTLTINSGSDIQSGSTVNIGASGGTNIGNIINVDTGATIESGAKVNIYQGNHLNVAGGNVTLNNTGIWAGNVNVTNGNLSLNGGTYNDTSNPYSQNGGTLNLENAAALTLNNPNTITTHGSSTTTVNVGTATGTDGSSLTLSGSNVLQPANSTSNLVVNVGSATSTGNSLNIAGGALATATQVVLNQNNNLNISSGNATLNGTGQGVDTWNGNVNLSGGDLTLSNFTKDTSGSGRYYQTGGVLNLTSGSNLTLNSNDTLGGTLNLSNSNLTLNSTNTYGTFNVSSGSLILNSTNASYSALNQSGGSTTIQNGSNIAAGTISGGNIAFAGTGNNILSFGTGATLDSAATINLTSGNNLNVSGGTATLNGTGTGVDTWAGTVNVSSGNFTADGIASAPTALLNQTGGTITISNGSTVNAGSMSYGTINFSGTGSALNFAAGTGGNAPNIFNLTSGNTLNIMNGNLDVDAGSLNGNINITGGTLITGVSNNAATGTFNQTGGTLSIQNGANISLGTGSSITAGNINFYSMIPNSLNIGTGATLASAASLNLSDGNTFNITGGTVTLNEAGTGIDTLVGAVNLSGGDLYLDSIISHGAFNMTGGNIYVENGLSGTRPLSGEHHFLGGTITLRNNGALTLTAPDTWTATNFNINGGALTLDGFTHDTTAAGKLNQTAGSTTLQNGSVLTMNLDAANSGLSGGSVIVNNSTLNLSTTAGATVGASLSGNSSGIINKNGTGTLLLTGQNSGYYGDLNVNAGSVDFNAASGSTASYISGRTNLGAGSSFNLNTNGSNVISSSNNILGTGTVNKTGDGAYTILAGSNGAFNYTLNVNQGSMNVVTNNSTTANFNAPVSVNSSTLLTSAASTNFNSGLALDHGYLGILNGGFNVNGNLSVGSTVNTMNGVVATNTITGGDLNIGPSGIAEYLIDISPKAGSSDKYVIQDVAGVGGHITTTLPNGVINISDFRIVGAPTLVQSVNLQIFDPTKAIDPSIIFTATDKTITSPLGQYGLSSLGGGDYLLSWKDFNPQVFRGQVATEAAYANQLTTNGIIFDHIGLVSQQLLSGDKPNVYANENPLFAPYQYSKKDGSLWYKAYGNIERLQLSQNINTQNNMWGSLIGGDFPLVELKNGWSVLPTAYVGYMGGYQTYSGVDMYQNGGQAGIMGTFYKGNFITSLLANAGGYYNDMSVAGTRDKTGNWFAGLASKSAYNINLPKDFILQPTMLLSYNAFGAQNWSSDFGGVGLTSGMLNGLNFAPGVNLILNKGTWSVYATTQLMINAMNGVAGTIEDVTLPTVKMGSTYISYGLGFTKMIKDRLSVYGQVLFSNGVRTGVGFQGGIQWKL